MQARACCFVLDLAVAPSSSPTATWMTSLVPAVSGLLGALIGAFASRSGVSLQIDAAKRRDEETRLRQEGRTRAMFLEKIMGINDALQPWTSDGKPNPVEPARLRDRLADLRPWLNDATLLGDLNEDAIMATQRLALHLELTLRAVDSYTEFMELDTTGFYRERVSEKHWIAMNYASVFPIVIDAVKALGGRLVDVKALEIRDLVNEVVGNLPAD